MDKRDFLKYGMSLLISSKLGVSFGSTVNRDVNLVTIFLRGGADGLSMLVPYNDKYYYGVREKVAINKNDCFPINETFGINKKMPFFNDLYLNNNLAIIPAAGQINNSRSHFQAQDVMEFGVNNVINYQSGFLSRLIDITKEDGVSFTENIPQIFKHEKIVIPTISKGILSGYFNFTGTPKIISEDIKKVYEVVLENIEISKKFTKENSELNNNSRMFKIAKAMKLGHHNVAFVDFDDWDTHADQSSRMNTLLPNLDSEIKQFKYAIGDKEWNKTIIIIMSEFGRVLKENGNGTDHGHGNLMMVTGGLLSKSNIYGDWLDLKKENLHEERDLPVIYENRDILAELFLKTYGLKASDLEYIFPNTKPTKFNII